MKKIYKIFCIITGLLILSGCATTKKENPSKPLLLKNQQEDSFKKTIRKTLECHYLVYLPEGYEKSKDSFPMILFLHGSGEQGDDINLVARHGPPALVEKGKKFPFIVISPQCPKDEDQWSNDVLIHLLDKVESQYRVDTTRVYLTGLSMGGDGTWSLAIAYPERFAAIAPICGEGNTARICRLKDVPVWAFHGLKDPVVPIGEEQDMVDSLKACGGDVKFTTYPNLGHNAWTVTYNNDTLYDWFLSHKKGK